MNFYNDAIGGELKVMTFGESPMAEQVSESDKSRVMHAHILKDDFVLMASDSMPGQSVNNGNSISISVGCTSQEEIDNLFGKLSVGGTITMPLQDTFWDARFGMCIDKFGMPWMFNFEHKK